RRRRHGAPRPPRAAGGLGRGRRRHLRRGGRADRTRVRRRDRGWGIALIRRQSCRDPAYQTLAPATPRRTLPPFPIPTFLSGASYSWTAFVAYDEEYRGPLTSRSDVLRIEFKHRF